MDQPDDIWKKLEEETFGWEDEQPDRSRQQRFDRQMDRCKKAWEARVWLAVARAAAFCRTYEQPPPEWLVTAIAELVYRRRTKDEAQQYRRDMTDFARWDAVTELRERGVEFCERGLQKPESERTELELLLISGWHPNAAAGEQISLEVCFEAVTQLPPRGSWSAVKQAYYRVENSIKAGQGAKYFLT
jgi:hypothetical protein